MAERAKRYGILSLVWVLYTEPALRLELLEELRCVESAMAFYHAGLILTLTTRSRLPMTWHMCDFGALQCQH